MSPATQGGVVLLTDMCSTILAPFGVSKCVEMQWCYFHKAASMCCDLLPSEYMLPMSFCFGALCSSSVVPKPQAQLLLCDLHACFLLIRNCTTSSWLHQSLLYCLLHPAQSIFLSLEDRLCTLCRCIAFCGCTARYLTSIACDSMCLAWFGCVFSRLCWDQ